MSARYFPGTAPVSPRLRAWLAQCDPLQRRGMRLIPTRREQTTAHVWYRIACLRLAREPNT